MGAFPSLFAMVECLRLSGHGFELCHQIVNGLSIPFHVNLRQKMWLVPM